MPPRGPWRETCAHPPVSVVRGDWSCSADNGDGVARRRPEDARDLVHAGPFRSPPASNVQLPPERHRQIHAPEERLRVATRELLAEHRPCCESRCPTNDTRFVKTARPPVYRHATEPSVLLETGAVEPVGPADIRLTVGGVAGDAHHLDLVPRSDVVDDLRVPVVEAERAVEPRLDFPDEPVEIAAPSGQSHEPFPDAADGPFGDDRRRRAADRHPQSQPVARPFAHVELQRRSHPVAMAPRVRPRRQRRTAQHVRVDHCDRARVRFTAYRVQEQRRRSAVDHDAGLTERGSTDGEIRAQVVARRHAGQRLHRSQRVVGDDAAQILQRGRSQHALRHRLDGRRTAAALHVHALAICSRAFGQQDLERDGRAGASSTVRRTKMYPTVVAETE